MTNDTTKCLIIPRCSMAIGTLVPSFVVRPTINGEILTVMIERRWIPGRFVVASSTSCRELGRLVIRAIRRIVVGGVASVTGIRRIGIVAVVANIAVAGYRCMGTV